MLIDEYRQHGRDDLAECVINGRKYQSDNEIMGRDPDLKLINAMTDAFL